jgi:hypothetical protein
MSAFVIVPVDVTASLTTNIYDDAPEWSGATTYAVDAVVKKTLYAFYNGVSIVSRVSISKSLVGGNLGNIPLTHSTAYWLYIGEATPAYASDTVYAVGHRVTSARLIYESLIDGNYYNSLDNSPNWVAMGKAEYLPPLFYDPAFTYSLHDLAGVFEPDIYGSTNYGFITVYRSLQAANVGHPQSSSPTWWVKVGITYPLHNQSLSYISNYRVVDSNKNVYQSSRSIIPNVPLLPLIAWQLVGVSNKYAMFDNKRTTQTIAPSTDGIYASFSVPASGINSLALLGLESSQVVINVYDSASNVIYTRTIATSDGQPITTWTEWFFGVAGGAYQKPSVVLSDLPLASAATISVNITNSSGATKCGNFVVGNQVALGSIEFGAESEGTNYSTVERDFSGEIVNITQRRSVPRAIYRIQTEKKNVTALRKLRADYSATPLVWVGFPDETEEEVAYAEALLINGIYRRFTINLQHPTHAVINLELEEI